MSLPFYAFYGPDGPAILPITSTLTTGFASLEARAWTGAPAPAGTDMLGINLSKASEALIGRLPGMVFPFYLLGQYSEISRKNKCEE
jgi:hypothetical protein